MQAVTFLHWREVLTYKVVLFSKCDEAQKYTAAKQNLIHQENNNN